MAQPKMRALGNEAEAGPTFIDAAAWLSWEWVHCNPAYFSLGLPTFSVAMETGTHCGLAANCCVASTSEVGREIPKLGAQADGDLQDLGQACMGLPAVEMPLGGQPPQRREKGHLKSLLTSLFSPFPLGGLWSNSAVSSLGELHVYCTFCTRNACSDHRVPLNYVFFPKQLFTPHRCHFLQLELFS